MRTSHPPRRLDSAQSEAMRQTFEGQEPYRRAIPIDELVAHARQRSDDEGLGDISLRSLIREYAGAHGFNLDERC